MPPAAKPAGPLNLNYDLISIELGPLFGIEQELQLTPELMANLQFSQPVWVEGKPIRFVVDGVRWTDLPGIKPVSDDPVTVTPTFYLGGTVTAQTNAFMSLVLSINCAEFGLIC